MPHRHDLKPEQLEGSELAEALKQQQAEYDAHEEANRLRRESTAAAHPVEPNAITEAYLKQIEETEQS